MIAAGFFAAVLAFLYFTAFGRAGRWRACALPAVFIMSMEVFWGGIVHGHSWLGVFVSCLIALTFFTVFYILIGNRRLLSAAALMTIAAGTVYYVSFDVYFSFFNDFPALSMYGNAPEAFTVLDSISALMNANHISALVFGGACAAMTVRDFTRRKRTG